MSTTDIARVGDWGCTATGRTYWPEDPRAGDFDIEDIAHALANQCRFGGHVRDFYSVAQHSVFVSLVCGPADALWGLLHDASEAYLIDIPRPVKLCKGMEGYRLIERRFMRAICEQYGLAHQMPSSVHDADEAMLAAEARDLMPRDSVRRWNLSVPPPDTVPLVVPCDPQTAKRQFLARFYELTEARDAQ